MRDITEPPVDDSPAGILRAAAVRVRCEHSYDVVDLTPTLCVGCGVSWYERIDMGDPLREPLAVHLEHMADIAQLRAGSGGFDSAGQLGTALAVARVILGRPS